MTYRLPSLAGLLPALLLCTALAIPAIASAQEEAPKAEATETTTETAAPAEEAAAEAAPAFPLNETEYAFDNMMLMLCAVLVLFMQSGFALVETGLNASKNAVNIMFKNFGDMCIGVILYFIIGYGLMYPGDSLLLSVKGMGVLGFGGVAIAEETDPPVAANRLPVPSRVRRDRCNDRFGLRGWPHEVRWLPDLHGCDLRLHLPDQRYVEVGWRLVG
jgi:predicted flap endonuclease-1-like 5' DNA nuclease